MSGEDAGHRPDRVFEPNNLGEDCIRTPSYRDGTSPPPKRTPTAVLARAARRDELQLLLGEEWLPRARGDLDEAARCLRLAGELSDK
jgi:hypothetical protein